MAIERTTSQGLEEFKGRVESVELEDSRIAEAGKQYHIKIKALDVDVKGETGFIHEWIRLPETSTAKTVPTGSVVDRYLVQLEIVLKAVKNATTVDEAFKAMVGRTFQFKRIVLGKGFSGHEARQYWAVVSLIS